MDKNNGNITLGLENGQEVELILNFSTLYKIRGLKKESYEKYNKIIIQGQKDVMDIVTILYMAYLCANINNLDACMNEMEFMDNLPYDPGMLSRKCNELIMPKKKKDSGKLS